MMKKILKFVTPILIGIAGGFLYYNFIGCNGTCAITGNPVISSLYGGLIGLLFVNIKTKKGDK
jgi:hypothetical protein